MTTSMASSEKVTFLDGKESGVSQRDGSSTVGKEIFEQTYKIHGDLRLKNIKRRPRSTKK
jgi:hypothetical protein